MLKATVLITDLNKKRKLLERYGRFVNQTVPKNAALEELWV
jgi:hypothetical protein